MARRPHAVYPLIVNRVAALRRYTALPPKRQRPRSGIERAPRRYWPRHRRFVKGHCCCVPGCRNTPVDFAHVKTRGAGNGDEYGVPLCREHHAEQHKGIARFNAKYGIDLLALARLFVRRSPDTAMRAALAEREGGVGRCNS